MSKSDWDTLTDSMKDAMLLLRTTTRQKYHKSDPYRGIKVDDAERLSKYLSLTPEQKQQNVKDFGDPFIEYANDMESMIAKYGGADNGRTY